MVQIVKSCYFGNREDDWHANSSMERHQLQENKGAVRSESSDEEKDEPI